MGLKDLKARYSSSEQIVLRDLPPNTTAVVCRTAFGARYTATLEGAAAVLSDLPVGTHAIECWSTEGAILADELTTVSERPGDGPVMGFATSFDSARVEGVLSWLRALRCTVVQFYDWMQSYSAPLPESDQYTDPLGRKLSRSSLERLVTGVRGLGAVAQAYAPICAAEPAFAAGHPDWLLFRNDGTPQHLGNLLQIMDPSSTAWQEHWLTAYAAAAAAIGFDGFHLDTYGYPRRPFTNVSDPVRMNGAYHVFVERLRTALPWSTLSFNQVNGVPFGFEIPRPPSFRYVEVWPPNDHWRHLEGLMSHSAGGHPWAGGAVALYPPVWDAERSDAVRSVVLTEAVTTVLGAGLLALGDDAGVLCHPYYPDHEVMDDGETSTVLAWHRFALRCRDLFRGGEDTSWSEIGDENGEVCVETPDVPVSPEPTGGSLFVRVTRTGTTTAVSCVDLSGSTTGSWAKPTLGGRLGEARIRLLAAVPGRCRADVAVLGADGGRFHAAELAAANHREGNAVELFLPIIDGWSVARFDVSC